MVVKKAYASANPDASGWNRSAAPAGAPQPYNNGTPLGEFGNPLNNQANNHSNKPLPQRVPNSGVGTAYENKKFDEFKKDLTKE